MSKQREFWIFTADYIRTYNKCELGDWDTATVSHFPHKDDTSRMFKVREVSPALDKAIEGLVRAVEWHSHTNNECTDTCMKCKALVEYKEAKGE